ncbi:MAG: ABC transporter substrate-binding protein [Clostridiales bacterium GWF2_36_10]|nr:MAG: ABC transporter substrate-binding protein [Clostridiales bacterium GWF2_36_10]HAN20259.1 ABC transporter substrate-binding protein [Clostridiales bacterium]
MKKIKFIALLLVAVMIIPFALSGCNGDTDETSSTASTSSNAQSEDESTASEAESTVSDVSEESTVEITVPTTIKDAGKIIMATSADFPPYEYKEGEVFVGIDVEIMQAVADLWEVELEITDMKFDSIITSVQTGKADVGMAGMTITEERLENVNFTFTYANATQVIIVKEDSDITDVVSLAGKKVGVQLGTTGDIYASGDESIASVSQYNTGLEAVLALTQDKIDAVIIDNEPAKVFVEKNEGLKIIDEKYTEEQYAIAIAKDNAELVDAINAALTLLDENGTLQAIIDKYIPAETD